MTIEPALDPARTAVLSMDMQAGIVSIYAASDEGFTQRAAEILSKCRALNMMVIHIQVGFRPGLPEVSPRNAIFNAMRTSERHQRLFQGEMGKIHPALGPEEKDIVITKHRISAFTGTDLDMILRSNDIETLLLFGIATSGVVLATVLAAADADYRIVVVKDCCADQEPDLQNALLGKFFPRLGTVVTSAELLESLPG